MMTFHGSLAAILIGAGLLATLPGTAGAEDRGLSKSGETAPYLNGGIGTDERDTMRLRARNYPLRMSFSARRDGNYIADVPVVIADARGNRVFELPSAGPILYVTLPKGTYTVSARFQGLTESQGVNLTGKEGKELFFRWKDADSEGAPHPPAAATDR